jgi:hypothetical protein
MTVQCYTPSAVANSVKIETVNFRARDAGLAGASFEYSRHRPPYSQTLVTPDTVAATYLLDLVRASAGRLGDDDGQLVLQHAAAAKNLMDRSSRRLTSMAGRSRRSCRRIRTRHDAIGRRRDT